MFCRMTAITNEILLRHSFNILIGGGRSTMHAQNSTHTVARLIPHHNTKWVHDLPHLMTYNEYNESSVCETKVKTAHTCTCRIASRSTSSLFFQRETRIWNWSAAVMTSDTMTSALETVARSCTTRTTRLAASADDTRTAVTSARTSRSPIRCSDSTSSYRLQYFNKVYLFKSLTAFWSTKNIHVHSCTMYNGQFYKRTWLLLVHVWLWKYFKRQMSMILWRQTRQKHLSYSDLLVISDLKTIVNSDMIWAWK